jgi:probable rRNA maturation factor
VEHKLLEIQNDTQYTLDIVLLEKIIDYLSIDNDIELIVSNNKYIKQINKQYRKKDTPTDVLSFPVDNEFGLPNIPLGTIIISVDFVKNKAKELNHTFNEEFTLLFIHGLLHLLGFDHEIDNGEHRKKEEQVVNYFNLPSSLIVRS